MKTNLTGNVANAIMVISTILYLLSALNPSISTRLFRDASYLREGFCIYHSPTSWYLNSHLLCVYIDAIGALALYVMSVKWESYDREAMKKVKENTVGIIGHGFGHFFLYLNYPPPPATYSYLTFNTPQLLLLTLSSALFFYMFFLSISLIPPTHRLFLSATHGIVLVFKVPTSLGFTYVQSVLLLTAAFYETKNPKKSDWYNDFSLLVHLPVSLAGWVEGIGCESYVRNVGGHAIYDASIPLGIMAFAVKRRFYKEGGGTKAKVY